MEAFMAIGIIAACIIVLVLIKKAFNAMYFKNAGLQATIDTLLDFLDFIPIFGRLIRFIMAPSEKARKKYEATHPESQAK